MGNNDHERRAKAEAAFQLLLDKFDRNIEAQMALAESLNRISDLGEDFMQVAVKVVDSADKYEQIFDALLEHYTSKAATNLGKFTPLLQNIAQIIEHVKSLREP